MYDEAELLDLVDEHDRVITTVARGEYYRDIEKHKGYLRAVEVFIRNDKGQLWVPRRQPGKKIAPNGLDYSCGGHVTAGEDYITSCLREVEEELNLKLNETDLRFIKKFTPTPEVPYFRHMYVYDSNEAPDYSRDDFYEYFWLTPEELIAKLEVGEPAKTSLLPTILAVKDLL